MLTSTEIPLYRVQGTHYECGRTIGNLCRERILRRIANDLPLLTPLFDFAQTEQGLELFNGFTEPIRLTFPWYWDELCGLVEGSGVPLEKLLVLNFEKETRMVFHLFEETNTCGKQVEDENGAHDCTTVLINRPDTDAIEILHNEDSSIALYHTAYLIEANIKSVAYNDHQRQSPNEKFIAFCYAGVIPGNAFGVNMHGFGYALNSLSLNSVRHKSIPRQIINRALLSMRNENELDQLLSETQVAYGFSINCGFFNEKNADQLYFINYEISPDFSTNNRNLVSKCFVLNDNQYRQYQLNHDTYLVAKNYLVHYNHYQRLHELVVERQPLSLTRAREQRGLELGEIHNVNDALVLLGDQTDENYPIFCVPTKTDLNLATLCTIRFKFLTHQLIIYRSNPNENRDPLLTYNLAELWNSEDNNN